MKLLKRPEGMSDIESLLEKNANVSKWYPIPVEYYRQDIGQGIFSKLDYHSKSNIAYNLQYLEYIELQLKELRVSSVIMAMLYKNFIVVAASIIEIVFYHLAKINGKIKLRYEKQVYRQDIKKPSNIIGLVEADKYTLYGYEILNTGIEDVTKFEQLISIVRDNKLLKDIDLTINKNYLKILRKLRNKIHLTTASASSETDYNEFYYIDYLKAKVFLFKVLTDSIFGKNKQLIFPQILEASKQQVANYKANHTNLYKWRS